MNRPTEERLEEIRRVVELSHSLYHKNIEKELLAEIDALKEDCESVKERLRDMDINCSCDRLND